MKKNLFGISLITMSCLYGLLAAVIILCCIFTKVPLSLGIIVSIIVLILQFLVSPFLTDVTMKWFYGAKFNEENLPIYLNSFINQIASKYHMKRPRIGFIDDGAPNAFTYGRTKNDARIILTRGIFNLLSEEEVKAVVAHEMGHATHYDMFFITVAQLVPLVLYGIYVTFTDSNDNSNDSSLAAIGLLAYLLYVISQYIILWLSRTREYYADSFAIEETQNPNALAEALVKVGYGLSTQAKERVDENGKKKQSAAKSNALGIFDSKTSKSLVVNSYDDGEISKDNIKKAMKWEMWNVWAVFYEIQSTHPLISKRLKAISNRCNEFNQIPYIDFDLTKPESYFDDFLLELFIKFSPLFMFLLFLIFICFFPQYFKYLIPIFGFLMVLSSYYKFNIRYKNKNYKSTCVSELLGEVKVSDVTCIPCEIKGNIIGRGNPGCIFNEDFVIKDDSGIMFLDYNQPINIINKIFALFKSKEYFDKVVTVRGWYRRSPVPYIEIYTMEIDGKKKKVYSYGTKKIMRILLMIFFILVLGFVIIL